MKKDFIVWEEPLYLEVTWRIIINDRVRQLLT